MIFLIFVALLTAYAYLWLRGTKGLKRFLVKHHEVTTQLALNDFKAMVREQMKIALVLVSLSLCLLTMQIYIMFNHGPAVILLMLLLGWLPYFISRKVLKIEKRTRNLVCEPGLQEEYLRICRTWKKKPWPDF